MVCYLPACPVCFFWGVNPKFFQYILQSFGVIAVQHLSAVIEHSQRYDIAMKVIMPFTVKAVFMLNIACLKGDFAFGEKTFHLCAVSSAISNKDHNPFAGRIE